MRAAAIGFENEGPVLFILVMGRSGTSTLTRVLALCGGAFPEKLLAGRSDNPTGPWEVEALELNDAFLHRHGSTWFDPTLRIQNELALSEPEREAFIGEIQALLNAWPTGDLLVVKESRIHGSTDFWFEAVKRAGADIIIPVRHPGEVSASLIARDRMSVELSLLLWLKYNLLGERLSGAWPRVFVEFRISSATGAKRSTG